MDEQHALDNRHCDPPNHTQSTNLLNAVQYGDEADVRRLLQNGADINAKDGTGQTPLHIAAKQNRKAIVKLLMAKGADIQVKDGDGHTPLQVGSKRARKEARRWLKETLPNYYAAHYPSRPGEGSNSEARNSPTSLETNALESAMNKLKSYLWGDETFVYPNGPKRNLINILTGELEHCDYETPYVIASYVWNPQGLPESPSNGLIRHRRLDQTKEDAAKFEARLNSVCEAFPKFVMNVDAADEGIDKISLPAKTSPGLEQSYQHEVYLLVAREASRRSCAHIWMDSLCIDQSDQSAVSQSIRDMADLYRNAECCVALSEILRRKIYFDPSPVELGFKWLPGDDLLSWIVGYHYLRVWLFQEIALSKEIVSRSGNVRIETSKFLAEYSNHVSSKSPNVSALLCDDPNYTHFKETRTRFPARLSLVEPDYGLTLNHSLDLMESRMATIHQDHVFGALALFPAATIHSFPVNYKLSNGSLSAILAYLRVCEGDLSALLMMRHCGEAKHNISTAPSWVPTGQGVFFQDGHGLPLEVASCQGSHPPWPHSCHILWPSILLLEMRYMSVVDLASTEAASSTPTTDHNVLLTITSSNQEPLPKPCHGVIEPAGYIPGQAGSAEDAKVYDAGMGEIQNAVRENRVVVTLLDAPKPKNTPGASGENSFIPDQTRAWLLLETVDSGKTWQRRGLVRTDARTAEMCNESKPFHIV